MRKAITVVVVAAGAEALLRTEAVAAGQALAAADQARALVPNVARADRVWEIAGRLQTFTTARRPPTRITEETIAGLRSATVGSCTIAMKAKTVIASRTAKVIAWKTATASQTAKVTASKTVTASNTVSALEKPTWATSVTA